MSGNVEPAELFQGDGPVAVAEHITRLLSQQIQAEEKPAVGEGCENSGYVVVDEVGRLSKRAGVKRIVHLHSRTEALRKLYG
ncbi:hypothetical protein [Saccharothrix xinjiangensis]|uniref:Uncharacterized protein n=1 Tax=Saccharothrix xinjiangensis TaxID=204798 RepID=A0ABV9XW99_9PSEU